MFGPRIWTTFRDVGRYQLLDPAEMQLIDLDNVGGRGGGAGGAGGKPPTLQKTYDEHRKQYSVRTEWEEWRAGIHGLQARQWSPLRRLGLRGLGLSFGRPNSFRVVSWKSSVPAIVWV